MPQRRRGRGEGSIHERPDGRWCASLDFVALRETYGHDIAALPRMVAPLVGDTTPDAVVQPRNEQELITLASWATA